MNKDVQDQVIALEQIILVPEAGVQDSKQPSSVSEQISLKGDKAAQEEMPKDESEGSISDPKPNTSVIVVATEIVETREQVVQEAVLVAAVSNDNLKQTCISDERTMKKSREKDGPDVHGQSVQGINNDLNEDAGSLRREEHVGGPSSDKDTSTNQDTHEFNIPDDVLQIFEDVLEELGASKRRNVSDEKPVLEHELKNESGKSGDSIQIKTLGKEANNMSDSRCNYGETSDIKVKENVDMESTKNHVQSTQGFETNKGSTRERDSIPPKTEGQGPNNKSNPAGSRTSVEEKLNYSEVVAKGLQSAQESEQNKDSIPPKREDQEVNEDVNTGEATARESELNKDSIPLKREGEEVNKNVNTDEPATRESELNKDSISPKTVDQGPNNNSNPAGSRASVEERLNYSEVVAKGLQSAQESELNKDNIPLKRKGEEVNEDVNTGGPAAGEYEISKKSKKQDSIAPTAESEGMNTDVGDVSERRITRSVTQGQRESGQVCGFSYLKRPQYYNVHVKMLIQCAQ